MGSGQTICSGKFDGTYFEDGRKLRLELGCRREMVPARDSWPDPLLQPPRFLLQPSTFCNVQPATHYAIPKAKSSHICSHNLFQSSSEVSVISHFLCEPFRVLQFWFSLHFLAHRFHCPFSFTTSRLHDSTTPRLPTSVCSNDDFVNTS